MSHNNFSSKIVPSPPAHPFNPHCSTGSILVSFVFSIFSIQSQPNYIFLDQGSRKKMLLKYTSSNYLVPRCGSYTKCYPKYNRRALIFTECCPYFGWAPNHHWHQVLSLVWVLIHDHWHQEPVQSPLVQVLNHLQQHVLSLLLLPLNLHLTTHQLLPVEMSSTMVTGGWTSSRCCCRGVPIWTVKN